MPNTTRVTPRMVIGPAAIQQFDPTKYYQRIQQAQQTSISATDTVLQQAAQRKIAAQQAAEQQQQQQLAAAQAKIQARIQASQANTQTAQAETVNQYAKMNARLQARQTQLQQQAKIGASATTAANTNFQHGDGRLVAVGGTASKKAAGIINEALKYRGMMYQWGGATPRTSFDCSGLVQWAYKSMGISLPRVSADQARAGRKIPLNGLRPGDLVAWDNSSRNSGADHIAIYIGNGQIIEAPHTGAQIRVRKLGNEQNAWGVQILQ